MHREYVLKLIPFESEHPVLEMGVILTCLYVEIRRAFRIWKVVTLV